MCKIHFLKKIIAVLNQDYKLPDRTRIPKILNTETQNLTNKIENMLKNAEHVSMVLDLWSKNTLGFYALVAHFLEEGVGKTVLLCLKYFSPPHTASRILELTDNVLKNWGFCGYSDPKIVAYTTDNGSNMVKAFDRLIMEGILELDDACEPKEEFDDNSLDIWRIPCMDHK